MEIPYINTFLDEDAALKLSVLNVYPNLDSLTQLVGSSYFVQEIYFPSRIGVHLWFDKKCGKGKKSEKKFTSSASYLRNSGKGVGRM